MSRLCVSRTTPSAAPACPSAVVCGLDWGNEGIWAFATQIFGGSAFESAPPQNKPIPPWIPGNMTVCCEACFMPEYVHVPV